MKSSMLRRIASGFGANIFGQGITVAIQLFSLPVFLYFWDTAQYGQWLMLSAAPAYFSMADVGMVNVAMNKMTMLTARGEQQKSNAVFQSALSLTLITTAAIGVIASICVWFLDVEFIQTTDRKLALILLIFVALGNIFSGLFDAVFRASSEYAKGVYALNLARFVEWLGIIFGLIFSSTMLSAAIGALVARSLASLLILRYTSSRYKAFTWGLSQASLGELKILALPALSFMSFPIGNALSIQGITLLVGNLFGPSFLAIFNTYRTLSRVVVQMIAAFSHAMAPEFSRQYGAEAFEKMRRTYRFGIILSGGVSILVSIALFVAAPWILFVWTHGKIPFLAHLFDFFLLTTILGGLWHVPRILLLATNQHIKLSLIYLGFSALTVLSAWLLSQILVEYGPVVSLVGFELVMLAVSLYFASKLIRSTNNRI